MIPFKWKIVHNMKELWNYGLILKVDDDYKLVNIYRIQL